MSQLESITQERPLVINSYQQLLQVLTKVLSDSGLIGNKGNEVQEYEEVNTRVAMKMLRDKGYPCKSFVGFKTIIDEYGITPVKRGRDHMYKVSDLKKLAPRH